MDLQKVKNNNMKDFGWQVELSRKLVRPKRNSDMSIRGMCMRMKWTERENCELTSLGGVKCILSKRTKVANMPMDGLCH